MWTKFVIKRKTYLDMWNADLRLRENADEFVANQARDFYTSVRAAQIHQIVTENRIFRLLTKLNFQEKSIWKSNFKRFWLQNLWYWITIILWDRTRGISDLAQSAQTLGGLGISLLSSTGARIRLSRTVTSPVSEFQTSTRPSWQQETIFLPSSAIRTPSIGNRCEEKTIGSWKCHLSYFRKVYHRLNDFHAPFPLLNFFQHVSYTVQYLSRISIELAP